MLSIAFKFVSDVIVFVVCDDVKTNVDDVILLQVTSLLRRVLPDVSPQRLAAILSIKHLPPKDFSIISTNAAKTQAAAELNARGSRTPGILDVFLSCIAKSLTVQMKVKNGSGKGVTSINLAECITSR